LPDLIGRPAAASVAELRRLGLKPNSVPEPVIDPSQAGMVIAQDPSAGEFVPASSRVRVEIGDHSLFDARQYGTPPIPPPGLDEPVPVLPEPIDLSDATPPWVSDEELAEAGHTTTEVNELDAVDLESRWDSLGREPDVDYLDDPVVGEEYPAFDPETGEILEDEPGGERAYYDESGPYEYEPRWTRKQRNRMLLALGVLGLLAALIVFSHLGVSGKVADKPTGVHAIAPTERVAVRTRVVTVTVPTVTSVRRHRRGHAPRHAPTASPSTVASSSSRAHVDPPSVGIPSPPGAASDPSSASSEGGDPAYLSPTGVVSPPPNDPIN
jgi:hypothetical protein